MGSNPCKQLVGGGGRIGAEDFEALLNSYDKDKNGLLDQDEASRFLKDLCKALGTKYDKQNASRIINRCDKEGKGLLSITEFSTLFQEAVLEAEQSGSSKAKKMNISHKASSVATMDDPKQQPQPVQPQPQSLPQPEPEVTENEKRYNDAFYGSSMIHRDEIQRGQLIGKGQFGEVYIACCRGMECAVKIPRETVGSAKFDMLLNELEIMKKANCPYVAMFMGACHDQASDRILIVMELMKGDAEKKCKEPQHTLSDRLGWIRQACKGQAWLHEMAQPILHLDLKPSNILFDDRGVFKVCDFGLSAVLPEGQQSLFMSRMRGTPIYMAPEIMIPGRDNVSHKSDTYSMAITAWEICTAKNCFSEYKALGPFKEDVHRNGRRPPMPEEWPRSLKDLFNTMWAPSPHHRPSFKEIVSSLDSIIEEVIFNEFRDTLAGKIQNAQATEWWISRFPGKLQVPWEKFYPVLFSYLGQAAIVDPSELGDFPEAWALGNATKEQLEKHAQKGAVQQAEVEAELERRKDRRESDGKRAPSTLTDIQKTLLCLKGLIGTTLEKKEGIVDAIRFGQFVAYFGPFDKHILNRAEDLMRRTYFHAFRSSNEAQDLLRFSADGTFLCRFSANRWGQVILSVKSKGKVSHLVVQNNSWVFKYKKSDQGWQSVPDLIDHYKAQLNLNAPQDGGPFVHLFSETAHQIEGYIADDDFDPTEYE